MALSPAAVVRAKSFLTGPSGLYRAHGILLLFLQYGEKKTNVYNILWALVFGFATLNILGLVARRFDTDRNRLSFGELLAITVVVASVLLLAWEMLYLFNILPIKLQPRY
ncbi:MAG TPA: hypothetical protein VH437_00305 [Terriglobales bacterium]|jgi:hypothetical protein